MRYEILDMRIVQYGIFVEAPNGCFSNLSSLVSHLTSDVL